MIDTREMPGQRIDKRALPVWRWGGAIPAVIMAIISGALQYAAVRYDLPRWLPIPAAAAAAFITFIYVVCLPTLRWNRWRYEVRDDEIDLQYGVFFMKRTLIPMVRVQHVDTKQGPIMRRYGLSNVTFSTAAGSHEIPALDNDTADLVRDRIAGLAKVSYEDV